MKKILWIYILFVCVICCDSSSGRVYKLTIDNDGGTGSFDALYYTRRNGADSAVLYADESCTIPVTSVEKPERLCCTVSFDVNKEFNFDKLLSFQFTNPVFDSPDAYIMIGREISIFLTAKTVSIVQEQNISVEKLCP